jgi:EthD domain
MQPTCKYIRMIKRGSGITLRQFSDYWLDGRAERDRRAMESTAIRRIVKNVSTGEVALGGAEPPFDAMLAVYFDSLADARAICGEGKLSALLDDDSSYVDPGTPVQEMIADEYQMGEKTDAAAVLAGRRRLKIIRTVFRRNDLNSRKFKDYWLRNHSKLEDVVIRQSPVIRIVATFAVPAALDGKPVPFDGMVELYFRSAEEIRSMFASAIPAMMRKDEENFVQMDAPAIRFIADEFITYERSE